jgi:phosphate transport system substrate-binding protein
LAHDGESIFSVSFLPLERLSMNRKKYWFFASLATFIILPVLLNSIPLLAVSVGDIFRFWVLSAEATWTVLGIPLFLALTYAIYLFGKKADLPDTFLSRYGPFIAPILFTLVVWLFIASINGGDFSNWEDNKVNYVLCVFLPFFISYFFAGFVGVWLIPTSAIVSYLFFMASFAAGTWRGKRFRTTENRKAFFTLALILTLGLVAVIQGYAHYQSVLRPDSDYPGLREEYRLIFGNDNWLVSPGTPPSLQIDRDYPKLDGATALVPIYKAAAKAIYRENGNPFDKDDIPGVAMSATPASYEALMEEEADMIFVFAPSEEQKKEAAEKGITYTLTPIAREAFVFLVHEQNPVTGLSVEQIREIYSGKINDWQEVGGAPGKIMAFQRNEGSGSQTAMLRNVMRETPMRKPLVEESYGEMSGLIRGVADYRNFGNAIGYSFRYYATVMNSIPEIRLLAVDGIAPTVENIQNGSYPFTDEICIVTARPLF